MDTFSGKENNPYKDLSEKKLISKYFDQISQDTGKYCFGVEDTIRALEMGAVETLMCWESLDVQRYELKDSEGKVEVKYLRPEQQKQAEHFKDAEGNDLDVQDQTLLIEWFAENYKTFGTTLEFVTNRSQEGSQFCKGFGGIGGLLRWKVNFEDFDEDDYSDDEDDGLEGF